MDWIELAKTVSGPLAGAVTGLAGSMLGLKKRMEHVEKKVTRHSATLQGHAALLENVDAEFDRLREELTAYQNRQSEFANNVRASNMDFAKDAELATFMTEQQERWQTIQRTLGHIEGYLGLNPQPQVPRPQPRQLTPRTAPPPFPTEYNSNSPLPRRKP